MKIIHTNDLHSHLEHWDLIARYIEDQQLLATEKSEPILTIDVGDAMDSAHPLVEATYGKVIVDLFNQSNYDIVTIGNNEGLNLSKERLIELYARADYDVVLSNIIDSDTGDIAAYASGIVYREIEGFNIAFLGLTAPYNTYHLNGYQIIDPLKSLQDQITYLKKQEPADLIILLSHLGLPTDRYIAKLFPEIHLILGGHTHHVLEEGEWNNQTLLCAAGKHGNYVGNIDIFYQAETNDWFIDTQLLSIDQLSEMYQMPRINNQPMVMGRRELRKRPVAHLPHSFSSRSLEGSYSFIQLALDAICDYGQLDNAILTSGLFLKDLNSGIVSENDLHEALPHPMRLCTVSLQGNYLLKLLEEISHQSYELKNKVISGLGFRGKVFGEIVFKGFSYQEQDNQWYSKNGPIQDDENYRFITVDHLWFLPYFPTIDKYGKPQLIFPDFLRHIVRDYIEKLYPIESS